AATCGFDSNAWRRPSSTSASSQVSDCSRRRVASAPLARIASRRASIVIQSSATPVPATALHVTTGGVQSALRRRIVRSALAYCRAAVWAAARNSPSALLIAIMSTSSTRPRLIPCSSSPAPGSINARKKSTMPATAVSDWPTPTVSTSTTSKPAASHTSMLSRVRLATPPSVPLEGEGRTNAFGSTLKRRMRVLSPRIEPPLSCDDGSTASTATVLPRVVRWVPSASMNVDFPTPGTPVMPTRKAPPVWGRSSASMRPASSRSAARVDSTREIARARIARSRASTPATYAGTSSRARARGRARAVIDGEAPGTTRVPNGSRFESAMRSALLLEEVEHDLGGFGDDGAGREDRRRAGLVQGLVVLRRNDAAHDHEDVVAPESRELGPELGHQRQVTGGQGTHADDVDVVVDGLSRALGRGLEQRTDVDVEPE